MTLESLREVAVSENRGTRSDRIYTESLMNSRDDAEAKGYRSVNDLAYNAWISNPRLNIRYVTKLVVFITLWILTFIPRLAIHIIRIGGTTFVGGPARRLVLRWTRMRVRKYEKRQGRKD